MYDEHGVVAHRATFILFSGAVAQLGEHLLCKQGVVGSIPSSSTTDLWTLLPRSSPFYENQSLR